MAAARSSSSGGSSSPSSSPSSSSSSGSVARRGLVYTGIDIGSRTLSIVSLRSKEEGNFAGSLLPKPTEWMKFDVVGARLFDLTGGEQKSAWEVIRALQREEAITRMLANSDMVGIEYQFVNTGGFGSGAPRGSVMNARIESALSVIARNLVGDENVFSVLSGAKTALFTRCVTYKPVKVRENLSQTKRAVQARQYNANKRHSRELADSALRAQNSSLDKLAASAMLPRGTKKDDIADATGIALVLLHRGLTGELDQ